MENGELALHISRSQDMAIYQLPDLGLNAGSFMYCSYSALPRDVPSFFTQMSDETLPVNRSQAPRFAYR